MQLLMALKNFYCYECNTLIQKESVPNNSGCQSRNHSWNNLGEVGNKIFQCKHCSTVVHSTSLPQQTKCSKSTSHSWHQL